MELPIGLFGKTYAQLRALTDEELIEQHDSIATGQVNVHYYLNELSRRVVVRQGKTMMRLTYVIAALTVVNVVAVIVNLLTT